MRKKLVLFIISCIFSIFLGVFSLEVIFRIWRPPSLKFKGNTVLLSRNTTIENNYEFNSEKIRNHIIIHRNSLGFRGEEPPLDFSAKKTIIAVGGSTTECIFVTEGKTWTDVLSKKLKDKFPDMWINNAGVDGHSTFGHLELIKQYIGEIKPDYVLFLVGINDMAIDQGREQDKRQFVETNQISLWEKARNMSMILSYFDYKENKKGGHEIAAMTDAINDYNVLGESTDYEPITDKDNEKISKLLVEYKERLESLIRLTQSYGIKPILITQPAVYGFGIDAETGVDLGKLVVSDFTENSMRRKGEDKWKILQMYNSVTKEVANGKNIPVIDLANELPKSTRYFYDFIHFTEEGAEKVGEIVSEHLSSIL